MKTQKRKSGRGNRPGQLYSTTSGRHPAWGAMQGMIQIAPGVDLTEPAFPDWEKVWLEANAWWLDDPKLNPKS